MTRPLMDQKIIVTRPAHQAEALCQKLEEHGAKAIRFPTINIAPPSTTQHLHHALEQLSACDIAIFTSANAVHHTLPLWPKGDFGLKILAIGPGTAQALKQFDLAADEIPQQHNTEGLLELPLLQSPQGKKITLFCGENPRPLLSETLLKRSAQVTEAFCYRRVCPKPSSALIQQLCAQKIHYIISTSLNSLQNLCDIFDQAKQQAWLQAIPLVVVTERMAEFASSMGFIYPPMMAQNATDQALIDAITRNT